MKTITQIVGLLLLLVTGLKAEEPKKSGDKTKWWDAEWTIRKKITVDTTSDGLAINEPIGTGVVLLRLHDGNFQFASAKEDASDLRFVTEEGKVLPYHIERFDALMNEAFVWIKAGEIKSGGQTPIWLYYGNAGPKAVKVEDAKATFDADTALVYHFADRGAASDASGNGNSSSNPPVAVDGSIIGQGIKLDAKSVVKIPASPGLQWADGAAMTWAAWFKPATLQANATIFSRSEGNSKFVIGVDNGSPFVEINGQRSAAGAPVAAASWHHLAVVAAGGKTSVFLDGVNYGVVTAGVPALNSDLQLGDNGEEGGTGFSGEFDELTIAKVARTPGFITFLAKSQGGEKDVKLVAFGEDEQTHSWFEGGYFGVIIKNLTPDGWAVIVILMIMAAISWFVMITKAGYLNKVSKANGVFMAEWSHLMNDLTALDNDDADNAKSLGGRVDKKKHRVVRNSPVFRIYHVGVEEIRSRMAGRTTRSLAATSMPAIRASLDGALVRETGKLNAGMVLLTIAISGGPFLGLLGTVVGVMITFAAIAAAGDVNVNSIAPGIAAALLATVAGLAVAIPALFGYNYLLTRVKGATADMHVFIDEFITRMAEFYCGDKPAKKKDLLNDDDDEFSSESGEYASVN
jgi:biopolymer transport protein ExbB